MGTTELFLPHWQYLVFKDKYVLKLLIRRDVFLHHLYISSHNGLKLVI